MEEMCKLLRHGGNLREITIDIALGRYYWGGAGPSDLAQFEPLLKPLERLSGLKSVIVKGAVTETYRAEFKRILEGDGTTRRYKKRKVGTDSEEEVVLRPRKKHITEVGYPVIFNNYAHN
jgi:hypothetical protein